MQRSFRPRKSANLSDSVQQQLNKYALAAGAAGVGVLVLGQTAEAKIVYTPADTNITPDHIIPLDLNHDGIVDFAFKGCGTEFLTLPASITREFCWFFPRIRLTR